MKLKVCFLTLLFFVSFSAMAQSFHISGVVTDDSNEPLPGVSIVVKGSTNGTSTDFDGKYSLEVYQSDILVFSFVGFNDQEIVMSGDSVIDVTMTAGVALDEVVIVGSRNANRTAVDTPVPVDVIDIEALTKTSPQVNLNQILNYVAPSFSSNTQTISDGTDHIDPASLRGLGPDQVLVLINGKRRHTSSLVNVNGTFGRGSVGTDLNAIPTAAVADVQILRDGASAQYGSDAIAGVINIVLKDQAGLSATITTGANFSENSNDLKGGVDGESVHAAVNFGLNIGDKGGFINFTGDFDVRQPTSRMGSFEGMIFHGYNAIQRVAAESGEYPETLSFEQIKFFAQGVDHFSTELKQAISATTSQDQIVALLSNDGGPIDFTEAELSERNQTREDYNMRVGQSELRSGRFMANLSLPLDDNGTELYSFGGISYRKGNAAGFYRLPHQSRSFSSVNLNGFLPNINSDIKDKSFAIGIKGEYAGWNIDFSNTWGQNSFDFTVTDSYNASQGLASSTSFNSGGFSFSQNTTNFDMSKYLDHVMSGVNVAFGAEYRLENYNIIAGEEASYTNYGADPDFFGRSYPGGAQVFPGFRPENEKAEHRNSIGGYLDVEADITDSFLLTGAIRYENYSDFGSTFNFKIASRLKVGDNFNIRGAVSTGFRAPSLHQIYYNATATQFDDFGVPQEVGTFSNDSRVAQELGIPQLKQEESASASLGFTALIPDANIRITIDGYFIAIEDRVTLTDTFVATTPELEEAFAKAGASRAAFFANAIDTESKGIDIVISHHGTSGKVSVKNDLAATFSQTRQVDDIHASQILADGGQLDRYFSESSRIYLEEAVPRAKINLSHLLSFNKFDLFLRNVYFGNVTSTTGQVFDPKIVTDLSLAYNFSESLAVTIGANNLLDVYPDQNFSGNSSSGRFVYSRRAQQFGTNGRFLFARLTFNLQ